MRAASSKSFAGSGFVLIWNTRSGIAPCCSPLGRDAAHNPLALIGTGPSPWAGLLVPLESDVGLHRQAARGDRCVCVPRVRSEHGSGCWRRRSREAGIKRGRNDSA